MDREPRSAWTACGENMQSDFCIFDSLPFFSGCPRGLDFQTLHVIRSGGAEKKVGSYDAPPPLPLSDSLEDEYSSFSSLMQHILYIWRNIKCAKQSYGMACMQKKNEKTICYKILSASKRVIAACIIFREWKAASIQIY